MPPRLTCRRVVDDAKDIERLLRQKEARRGGDGASKGGCHLLFFFKILVKFRIFRVGTSVEVGKVGGRRDSWDVGSQPWAALGQPGIFRKLRSTLALERVDDPLGNGFLVA